MDILRTIEASRLTFEFEVQPLDEAGCLTGGTPEFTAEKPLWLQEQDEENGN